MKGALLSRGVWIAAICMVTVLVGCGRKEESVSPPYAMPEVNDVNCKLEVIKAMPAEVQQRFADMCARRSKPIQSEKKSYNF
ncbi:MAG: entry exclusion lipoprotein TrbK [Rhodoferax sp.]